MVYGIGWIYLKCYLYFQIITKKRALLKNCLSTQLCALTLCDWTRAHKLSLYLGLEVIYWILILFWNWLYGETYRYQNSLFKKKLLIWNNSLNHSNAIDFFQNGDRHIHGLVIQKDNIITFKEWRESFFSSIWIVQAI